MNYELKKAVQRDAEQLFLLCSFSYTLKFITINIPPAPFKGGDAMVNKGGDVMVSTHDHNSIIYVILDSY